MTISLLFAVISCHTRRNRWHYLPSGGGIFRRFVPVFACIGSIMQLSRPALIALLLLCSPVVQGATLPKLAPHEATYELHLEQNRPSSHVVSADGKLVFILGDSCEGWTNEQNLDLQFVYTQGEAAKVAIRTSSWEAKDGSRYTFSSRTLNNDKETEAFRGKAQMEAKGGTAIYTQPKDKKIVLSRDTLFPTQHSLIVIQAALAGQKVPNQMVFDGTDANAQSDVSVFLGKPIALADDKTVAESLRGSPLLQGLAWPTQMAFFAKPDPNAKLDDEASNNADDGLPDYELMLDLLPNGVARKLLIDYGNFSVRGKLTQLKPLPDTGCDKQ